MTAYAALIGHAYDDDGDAHSAIVVTDDGIETINVNPAEEEQTDLLDDVMQSRVESLTSVLPEINDKATAFLERAMYNNMYMLDGLGEFDDDDAAMEYAYKLRKGWLDEVGEE